MFRDPRFKLKAKLICGSLTQDFESVSGCQNKENSKIRIKFEKNFPKRLVIILYTFPTLIKEQN